MAKRSRPPEFPTDWHFEAHLGALERELTGRCRRLEELREVDAPQEALDATQAEIDAVRAQLTHYGAKSTRPRQSREKRA